MKNRSPRQNRSDGSGENPDDDRGSIPINLDDTRTGVDGLDDTVADPVQADEAEDTYHGDIGGEAGESIFETGVAELESQINVSPVVHGGGTNAPLGNGKSEASAVAEAAHAKRMRNSFSRLLVWGGLFLVGLAFTILALILRDLYLIVLAAVLFPLSAVKGYRAYGSWRANKRFGFRLLESLGEDVSDVAFEDRYRQPKKARKR